MYIVQCIMHRSPDKHLSPLKDIRSETKFDADVLDQIVKAKTSLCNEIYREINVERHDEILSISSEQTECFQRIALFLAY